MSYGLAVNPRSYVASFPPQVLADPVGRRPPFLPFVADGALGNGQNRRYIGRRWSDNGPLGPNLRPPPAQPPSLFPSAQAALIRLCTIWPFPTNTGESCLTLATRSATRL
jgi:hypothetical protein